MLKIFGDNRQNEILAALKEIKTSIDRLALPPKQPLSIAAPKGHLPSSPYANWPSHLLEQVDWDRMGGMKPGEDE